MRLKIHACLLFVFILSGCALWDNFLLASPPNIVIIFTDDQGWADIGTQGAQGFKTPHLDQLAAEGTRFTSFYVSQPACSSSRTSLLTG